MRPLKDRPVVTVAVVVVERGLVGVDPRVSPRNSEAGGLQVADGQLEFAVVVADRISAGLAARGSRSCRYAGRWGAGEA
jgi:hypothetical protein